MSYSTNSNNPIDPTDPIDPADPEGEFTWNERLAGYVLGDLTPEEAAQVKEHLNAHPELGAEVRALQATLSLLPLGLPEVGLPEVGLPEMAQLETGRLRTGRAEPLADPAPLTNRPDIASALARRWRRIAVGVGIGFGLLALGLGLESYRLRQELAALRTDLAQRPTQSPPSFRPARATNHLFVLKSTDAMYTASGSLVVIPNDQQVLLNIQNLQPLPSGQTYRLWTVVKGKPMKCADFNTSTQGHLVLAMPLDPALLQTPSVLITVEPAQSKLPRQGSAVMTGRQLI